MNFVERYLNRHHLFSHPHKWFFALVFSPIHFAELIYKKRYHLRFKNARKLFIFDSFLLLSIVVLAVAAFSWYKYDPTVKNFVELSVKSSPERKRSGDIISFEVNYKNLSHKQLKEVVLSLVLPEHFTILKAEPSGSYQTSSASFHLPDLMPKEGGTVSISGRLFQTPGEPAHISTYLSYRQAQRTDREEKASAYISEPQSSVLSAEIRADSVVLAEGRNKFTLTLKNEGDTPLIIVVPFTKNKHGVLQSLSVKTGSVNGSEWKIESLLPGQVTECSGEFVTQIPNFIKETSLSFTPAIVLASENIPQKTISKNLRVVHPQIEAAATWADAQKNVLPEGTAKVKISLKNVGQENIGNVTINLPLPTGIVDIQKIKVEGLGLLKENLLILNSKKFAELTSLPVGKNVELIINLPILSSPAGGTDLILSLAPRIQAVIDGINSGIYEENLPKIELPLGTKTYISSELRYFTNDGDQLGRGPLPPVIGKETKYWAIISIKNTSSEVAPIEFKARLTNKAIWTGKTSVSIGKEVQYNEKTRIVSWSAPKLSAHETAGIYLEIGYMPETATEKNVVLLEQITTSGTDQFIGSSVLGQAKPLDNSLINDTWATKKILGN